MDENPPELPEVPLSELRRVIMERMGWDETELREQMEEYRDQALCGITDEAGQSVTLEDLSEENTQRAILNLLYHQYIVELQREDPLGLHEEN